MNDHKYPHTKIPMPAPFRRPNYEDLANAIVLQAVEDWRGAREKSDEKAEREIERFFRSAYFARLTDLDAEYLLERLNREKKRQSPKRPFRAMLVWKGRRYTMKPNEKKLYDFLGEYDGMTLFEEDITGKTGMSHGSFIAARKGLVDAGILRMEKRGQAVKYTLTLALKVTGADVGKEKTTEESGGEREEDSTVEKTSTTLKGTGKNPSLAEKTSDTLKGTGKVPSIPAKTEADSTEKNVLPIEGVFAEFDDWFDAFIAEYGDVSIEGPYKNGVYRVTILDADVTQTYATREDEDGFSATLVAG